MLLIGKWQLKETEILFSSSVYSLGKQNHFNKMFTNKKEKFTYLVPSDEAWRQLHKSFATVHKILFMGDFSYQV